MDLEHSEHNADIAVAENHLHDVWRKRVGKGTVLCQVGEVMFVERESFDEETCLSDLVFGHWLARPVEPVPYYVDTPALGWLQESAWLGDLISDIEVATENVKGHEVHFGARNQRTQP
jgi:hypothetical protein